MGKSKNSDDGSVGLIFEGEVLDYHSSCICEKLECSIEEEADGYNYTGCGTEDPGADD